MNIKTESRFASSPLPLSLLNLQNELSSEPSRVASLMFYVDKIFSVYVYDFNV